MDQKFYLQPFAFAGDVTAIPDAVQPSGSVSFNQGFGFDYQRELGVDPDAKAVPRQESNYLYKTITENLGVWQRYTVPEWITAANNGGVDYPYSRHAMVRYRALPADPFQFFISRVDNNTATPAAGANWAPFTFEVATTLQATTGVDDTTIMTPLKVKDAITATPVVVPDASGTVKGIIELATQAEVNTGTDAVRAVTPATLAVKLTNAIPDATTTVKGIVELATSAETTTGTDAVRAVTPAGVKPALDAKAPLASPTFTGVPAAPTAAAGTNTTQLATTAFVTTADNLKANLASPAFTGVPTAPTAVAGTNTAQLATCSFVQAYDDAAKANLASPTFTGVPAAPTAAAGTNTTQLATTAFVQANMALKASLTGAAFTGTVSNTGSFTAAGGFQKTSSRLVKRDIRPLPYGLADIERIETGIGRYLQSIDPTEREHLFVFAEDTRPVIPEIVIEDGYEHEGKQVPTVDYDEFGPVFIEALKEIARRLRALGG